MTVAEFKLFVILALTFGGFTFILKFKQDRRKNMIAFLIACLKDFAAKIPLGPEINQYTPIVEFQGK